MRLTKIPEQLFIICNDHGRVVRILFCFNGVCKFRHSTNNNDLLFEISALFN